MTRLVKRILAPVDYSDTALEAVRFASKLAQQLGAELEVLHVWETQPNVPLDVHAVASDGTKMLLKDLVAREAEDEMERFLGKLTPEEGAQHRNAIVSGSAARAIVDRAVNQKFDLVVMGTQGRTGFQRFVVGSVADRVMQASSVPVLVVPPR